MTELYLDSKLIDLEDARISQTLQSNVLGDIRDRQLNFTNRFRVPLTRKNNAFFGQLKTLKSVSNKPFIFMDARLVEDGVELLVNGTAQITSSDENNAEVVIYSGINGIFDAIGNASIRTLDWSDLNHLATVNNVADTFDGLSPYIYGLVGTTGLLPVSLNRTIEYMQPSVFEWKLFDMIFTQAGFTYEMDNGFFNSDEFRGVVIPSTTQDKGQNDLRFKDFSKMMPDITRKQFLKEIFVRYGLMFKLERKSKKYVFKHMRDVLRDRDNAIDWSKKYAGNRGFSYTLGDYAETNTLKYSGSNENNTDNDGAITVEAPIIRGERNAFTSVYRANTAFSIFDYIVNQIFSFDDEGNIEIEEVDPWVSRFVYPTGAGGNIEDLESNAVTVTSGNVPVLRFFDLSFRRAVHFHYQEIRKIIRGARITSLLINLNTLDVANFDPFKLIFIEEYGAFFYINKITNYRKGALTRVEGVKIPTALFEPVPPNTAPSVLLLADNYSPAIGEATIFDVNVFDAEDNIDKWKVTFSNVNGDFVEGLGNPPTQLTKLYPSSGQFTAKLEVVDFEGLTGISEAVISVAAVNNTSLVRATGEYFAPAGAVINVQFSIQGAGSGLSSVQIRTQPNGGGTQLDALSGCLNVPSCNPDPNGQFTMPSSGVVYLTGQHFAGPDNNNNNVSVIQLEYQGEIETATFQINNPLP